MSDNYKAWNIDTGNLRMPADLLHLAVLAPSSHNSQPWNFKMEDNLLRLSLDPRRRLKESDTNDRQAIISIGCAAEHIAIGAEYYGYAVQVSNYDEDEPGSAHIRFTKDKKPMNDPDHLIHWIPRRVTNRTPYENRFPDEDVLQTIRALAQPMLRIDIATDKMQVARLGDVAIAAGVEAMQNGGFRKELSTYLKPNTTRSPIGMPGFGFGFPTPLSYVAPLLVRVANMAKLSQTQDHALFAHTPVVIVISTAHDTPADWFLTGRTYARIALIAAQAGMSTAPWGAPIQIGGHYLRIQEIINIVFRPQFFCRLGYPTASTPHTPRLQPTDVQS